MKALLILLFPFYLIACKTKHRENKIVKNYFYKYADSTLSLIRIDSTSPESNQLKNFWRDIKKLGYLTNDTLDPFTKVIFKPKTAYFYIDTLKLTDCKIFDSINIHRIEIKNSFPL